MAPKSQGPSYIDEHHQRISEFADEYFDDDEERSAFVDTLMERRGYQRTTGWSLPAPPPPGGQDGGQDGGQGVQPKRPAYFRR